MLLEKIKGKSAKEVAKTFGVHVSTIYRLYEAELP
jgi:transposase